MLQHAALTRYRVVQLQGFFGVRQPRHRTPQPHIVEKLRRVLAVAVGATLKHVRPQFIVIAAMQLGRQGLHILTVGDVAFIKQAACSGL